MWTVPLVNGRVGMHADRGEVLVLCEEVQMLVPHQMRLLLYMRTYGKV